jgi:hypothetical protein
MEGSGGSAGTLGGDAGTAGGDAAPPPTLFYANSDTTLYQLDPNNLSAPMVTVGNFDCVPSQTSVFTDIAMNKIGKLFGVSPVAAWPLTIQPNGVVHCDAKWPLSYDTHFNGLTVAPENTVDTEEVLIGGNALGQLWKIDQQTGATTQIGTLGTDSTTGLPWTISGDLVFMANHGNPLGFATVRTCPNGDPTKCSFTDYLMEIDVKALKPGTQSVMKAIRGAVNHGQCSNPSWPPTFGSIFGIIAYKDKAYGFSRSGDFIEISNGSGAGCLVWSNPNVKFAGAAINTLAPVEAPPPVH